MKPKKRERWCFRDSKKDITNSNTSKRNCNTHILYGSKEKETNSAIEQLIARVLGVGHYRKHCLKGRGIVLNSRPERYSHCTTDADSKIQEGNYQASLPLALGELSKAKLQLVQIGQLFVLWRRQLREHRLQRQGDNDRNRRKSHRKSLHSEETLPINYVYLSHI